MYVRMYVRQYIEDPIPTSKIFFFKYNSINSVKSFMNYYFNRLLNKSGNILQG